MLKDEIHRKNLKVIDISLTEKCNLKCKHCGAFVNRVDNNQIKNRNELDKNEYFDIIKQVKQLGCNLIIFSGGEPFLNKDIWDIIDFTERNGILYSILSNGSLIDEDILERLKSLKNLAYIRLSLDYVNSKKFEDTRMFKDGYKKIVDITRALVRSNINVGIGMTIFEDNLGDIEDIASLSQTIGAVYFRAIPVLPIGKSRDRNITTNFYVDCVSNLMKIKSKYETQYYGTIGLSKDLREEYRSFLFSCPGAVDILSINAYGHVSICSLTDFDLRLPTVREESIEKLRERLLQGKREYIRSISAKLDYACSSCDFFETCKGGCIAEILSRGGIDGNEKQQPFCLKQIWPEMLEKVSLSKEIRRTVNNLIIEKIAREKKGFLLTCCRSLPFWFVYTSKNGA